jgi:prepilin-type N-terminal cleavage/methylation domain-containing protein
MPDKIRVMNKALSNQSGFTLIEMMIVGGILSVLMLAFSGYMFQQAKQNKVAEAKQSYTQLKANVLSASAQADSLSSSETMQFNSL